MTKLLGVIGDPIAHSLSPLIHNGWIRDLGFDATYEAMQVPEGQFAAALRTLETRDVLGVNVTLPHKTAALNAASNKSARASRIGAANTLTFERENGWSAENTDAPGFVHALGEDIQYTDSVLVLGAGGSARAVIYGLAQKGIHVVVLNRTESKAKGLVQELATSESVYGGMDRFETFASKAKIIVNTTSSGHGGGVFEVPESSDGLFFDLSYGAVSATQIGHAKARGWRVRDGLDMLVAQAALSFEIWFGERPPIESALRRCKVALEVAS